MGDLLDDYQLAAAYDEMFMARSAPRDHYQSLNGVLQVSKLARWDADLLDGARLARRLVDDLLLGMGADLSLLAEGHAIIDAIARRQPLARPLPVGDLS